MVELTGPAFPNVDHRLMSLQLVEVGLTDAAMFTPDRKVVQPTETDEQANEHRLHNCNDSMSSEHAEARNIVFPDFLAAT